MNETQSNVGDVLMGMGWDPNTSEAVASHSHTGPHLMGQAEFQ